MTKKMPISRYASVLTDKTELYFRGNRFLESKRNYFLKTVRILSFSTGIIPAVGMYLSYRQFFS